jgi:hypothetical protein
MSEKPNGGHASKLYVRTISLLRNRSDSQPLRLISDETGLPEAWLWSLLNNPEMNPGVHRIEHLYEYLSGKRLQL